MLSDSTEELVRSSAPTFDPSIETASDKRFKEEKREKAIFELKEAILLHHEVVLLHRVLNILGLSYPFTHHFALPPSLFFNHALSAPC